jgi:hypothetical protein
MWYLVALIENDGKNRQVLMVDHWFTQKVEYQYPACLSSTRMLCFCWFKNQQTSGVLTYFAGICHHFVSYCGEIWFMVYGHPTVVRYSL